MQMPSGKGDLGTRSSEKATMQTSAGKAPTMSAAFNGHMPDMGKACCHLENDMKERGSKE